MIYPTFEEVESANRIQLAKWMRFLPGPGMNHIENDNFDELMKKETDIIIRIMDRFHEMGGMTPAISKLIGY